MNVAKLEKILKTKVKKEPLFTEAFTHCSYLNEHPDDKLSSNERLEFLGDAILQFLSSRYLFKKYPNFPEGDLTNVRAAIVRTESLAQEAKKLGFGDLLLLSKGEEASGGREREYILANTFEAVLGAIFLNEGKIESCQKFLEENLFFKTEKIVRDKAFKDYKSTYQEIIQEKIGLTPTYRVLDEWGPDHAKTFKVGVFVGDTFKAEGVGPSKQEAEHAAAKAALDLL